MIPKIIHYCWMGGAPLPELAERCMASWKEHMPNWEYKCWNEANFDIAAAPLYVKQAYEARKFAFVSDYVRLWALEQYGGLYMDVDFLVHKPFDYLMDKYPAFAGVEGCKRQAIMMGVIASEAHGAWVKDMIATYNTRPFVKEDGSFDLTPNTTYFTDRLESQGYVPDGKEKDVYVKSEGVRELENERGVFFLHVLPVWAFCPRLTTGEDVRTEETYCEHMGLGSWNTHTNWQTKLVAHLSPKWKTRLIKWKRRLLG